MNHIKQNGATPRKQGNKGKKPAHALNLKKIENAENFIKTTYKNSAFPNPKLHEAVIGFRQYIFQPQIR